MSVESDTQRFVEEIGLTGPVAVEGGRTRWATGGEPNPDTNLVRAPSGIIEYQPEEMILRVGAGTPMAEVEDVLAAEGQQCALPHRADHATVGGAVAVGENHVEMLGRGALRSAILQLRYVSADGLIVSGGGPTVKNVSGFDLPRLMVGSLGTLGLFCDITVRTNPRPTRSLWLAGPCDRPDAARRALTNTGAFLWDGITAWVLLTGHDPVVADNQQRLKPFGAFVEVAGPPPRPPHRWSLPPGNLRALKPDGNVTGATVPTGRFIASIGVGTVWADQPPPRRRLDPAAAEIHTRTKDNFDPTGRLNPGRNPANR